MIFHCIRHGESEFNAQGRIQGQADIPLSDFGRIQSSTLPQTFAGMSIDALFSSPLRRAMETAAPLAEALGLELQTDDRLMEIDAGIFQELVWSEIVERYPQEAAHWKSRDPDYRIPGGETRRELMQRGREAFESLLATGYLETVVVAHGGLLSAVLKSLLEVPDPLHPFRLYNCSISRVVWNGEDIELRSLNEVAHLHDISANAKTHGGDL